MNAAILIMSSAALVGADPTPPPPPPAAPVVVSGGAGCSNCGTATYPTYSGDCCASSKPRILDRLKSRFGKKSNDCGCAPAPVCNPCPAPTCCEERPNLFDTLKARWGKKKSCGPACCDPCGTGATMSYTPAAPPVTYPAPGPGTTTPPPPKEMPKPQEKGSDKGNAGLTPAPVAGTSGGSPY